MLAGKSSKYEAPRSLASVWLQGKTTLLRHIAAREMFGAQPDSLTSHVWIGVLCKTK